MNNQSAVGQFASTQSALAVLKRAFEDTATQLGGIRALSGFSYQMETALLALLKAWTAEPARLRSTPDLAPMLVEALSDYTILAGSAIVCCQVKRTLRSDTTLKALEEFWLIWGIAKSAAPQTADLLRFRIVHRRLKEGYDFEGTIARWLPQDGADPADLALFKQKIDVRNEPSPSDELLVLLANRFTSQDPLNQLRQWLAALFRSAEGGGNFSAALEQIWSDLRGLENRSHLLSSPGYLWSLKDQPPQAVEPGPILVGGRPKISDLREGNFSDRQIFEKLAEKAEDWIVKASTDRDAGRKLSMFWISGRSGSGKSVALLHVLAALHANENDRHILWLGNDVASLPACFRWARPLLQDGRQVIIGIDDPFPAAGEYELAGILLAARQELSGLLGGQDVQSPLIVCCGPTEQRLRFRQQHGDLVKTYSVELPKEEPKERAALWEWYQRRTGKEDPEPYVPEQDVLLVQLFFEWWTGAPMEDFARSFRKRLQGLDQTPDKSFEQFMYMLFAVNRLYVNYPIELVTKDRRLAAFETAFSLLHQEEKHLTIEEEANRSGVRITHPHLANAIYESSAWFPRESYFEPQRRDHVRSVVLRSLAECAHPRDRLAVLWAIARLADPTTDEAVRERLHQQTISGLLFELTEMMRKEPAGVPVSVLPVLIELRAMYPAAQFAFSPLLAACEALERQTVAETGFRLLCHKILQHHQALHELDRPATVRAVAAIRAVLKDQTAWAEWPHIAVDFKRRIGDRTIDPWVAAWIRLHLDHARTPFFIQDIASHTRSDDVAAAALLWVEGQSEHSMAVPFVLEALLSNFSGNETLLAAASSWLDQHDWNATPWTFLWEDLVRVLPPSHARREYWLSRGREWLSDNEQGSQHPSWPGLLALEIKLNPADGLLRQSGWNWLTEAGFDHGAWTFVWESLEETGRKDPENRGALIAMGRRWLLENSEGERHGAWPGVIARVIAALPADSQLQDKGWEWLQTAGPRHVAWGRVMVAIEHSTRATGWPNRKKLLEDVARWVSETPPDDPGWYRAWRTLLEKPAEIDVDVEDLYRRGRDWLKAAAQDRAELPFNWPNVLTHVLEHYPDDIELHELGWRWLEDHGLDHARGVAVWSSLLDTTPDDWRHRGQHLELGRQWFASYATGYDLAPWPYVATRLLRAFPDDDGLREAAWRWLDSKGIDHEQGTVIWTALFDETPIDWGHRERLLELGSQWFALHRSEHSLVGWPYMATRLLRVSPQDAELRESAWNWLVSNGTGHSAGPLVWSTLFDATRGNWNHREEHIELGRQWFALHGSETALAAWPSMISRLLRVSPLDAELRESAWNWLVSSSIDHSAGPLVWTALFDVTRGNWSHREEHLELGRQWLAIHRSEPALATWPSMITRLLRVSPEDTALKETVWTWLVGNGIDHDAGTIVWGALYDVARGDWSHREEHLELGRQWFALHRTAYAAPGWAGMVTRLVRAFPEDAELQATAWNWLETKGIEHDLATLVWTTLFEVTQGDWAHWHKHLELGRQWFVSHRTEYDLTAWPHMVTRLLRAFPADPEIRRSGLDWLKRVEAAGNDGLHLWRSLYDSRTSDAALDEEFRRLGTKWIKEGDPSDPQWGAAWEAIFSLGERQDAFIDLGFQWARDRIGEDRPSFVLPKLLSIDSRYDAFLGDLIAWLQVHDASEALWADNLIIVLNALERREEQIDDELFIRASAGLNSLDASHRWWGAIWVSLHDQRPHESDLIRAGHDWIRNGLKADTWASVWLRLTKREDELDELVEHGRNWLAAMRVRHRKWPEVWQRLWEHSGDVTRLGPLGIRWLRGARSWPQHRMIWQEVWGALWAAGFQREELRKLKSAHDPGRG